MLIVRNFHWADVHRLASIFNAVTSSFDAEESANTNLTAETLSQPGCDPERNLFVAESDGFLVGFALLSVETAIGRVVIRGGVTKAYRHRKIGRKLLREALLRCEKFGSVVIHIQVNKEDHHARALLESEMFRSTRRYLHLVWCAEAIPVPDIRGQYNLRSFRKGDGKRLTILQNNCFRGSWGFCPNTDEEVEAKLKQESSFPDGVLFITHRSKVVAYNWTFRNVSSGSKTGWIGMIGVDPGYRGKGFGKVVLRAGMSNLFHKGVEEVLLEVDDQNTSAKDLYFDTGFKVGRQSLWYERASIC